ncbi:MAG: amidohydrolase [Clostridia bacterium]|nr:amidohydrolase [Clostridia bacterium]
MIIDFRVRLPLKEQFPDADPSDLSFVPSYMSHYLELFSLGTAQKIGEEELLASMEASGVDKCVLQAEWEFGDYRHINLAVKRLVEKYPDKFIGFCTVHPEESRDMAKEVEGWVRNEGMKGVNLQPWAYKVYAHDRVFYPLYEKCLELNIPVTIHTGINYSLTRTMDYGRPLYLDIIACDFPDLKIVANHGGWPWVNEMVAVAWKHPNVYIETGAVSPKYIGRPGTGWEAFIHYGNTILKDQILFASEWPLLPMERLVSEANELPLRSDVRENYLYRNAARILGLE